MQLDDTYAAVTMHVAGSLIFLGAALFAAPQVVPNTLLRVLILAMLLVAILSAGRTAAFLGIGFGVLFFAMANIKKVVRQLILLLPGGILFFFIASESLDLLLGVSLRDLIGSHLQRLTLANQPERVEQVKALFEGATNTGFLGAGHGIGVSYVRSFFFPWRYEAVYVALLYKVGAVGLFLLMLPFLLVLFYLFSRILRGRVSKLDIFFGAGFCAVLFAGVTNPYLEAFTFQWMYAIPVYHFLSRGYVPEGRRQRAGAAMPPASGAAQPA